jgi:hypothetical protein
MILAIAPSAVCFRTAINCATPKPTVPALSTSRFP